MITAVTGVVLAVDEVRIILGALERVEQPHANERLVMMQLRRAAQRTGALERNRVTNASNASPNARNPLLQNDSAHHDRYALTSKQAADTLNITPNAVRDLRRRGVLTAKRVGGRWRFNADEVAARSSTKG